MPAQKLFEEQQKDKLRELASQLRSPSNPTAPISDSLAIWAGEAIERYLSGEEISLDAAFGVRPKPGRPEEIERRLPIAVEILDLLLEGKKFPEITDILNKDDPNAALEESALRKIFKEFRIDVMAIKVGPPNAADGKVGQN